MAFDYKKEYKEFYLPPKTPGIVTVPAMNFLAVRGQGDPNEEGGAYKQALELLYAVAFTIKMSKMGDHKLDGYFDYVVPPLEGIWWQEGIHGVDYSRKKDFQWICLHGENVLTPPKKASLWSQFLEKFEDPIIRILLVAWLLSMIIAGVHCWEPEAKGFTAFLGLPV